MPDSSSNIAVFLLCLLPAGTRGQTDQYCNDDFIDGDGALAIPSGWHTVPPYAFSDCSALASVSFSNSGWTSVPPYAFSDCTSLASVSFSNSSVTSVGEGAFAGCGALASVSFSNSIVTSVGDSAF